MATGAVLLHDRKLRLEALQILGRVECGLGLAPNLATCALNSADLSQIAGAASSPRRPWTVREQLGACPPCRYRVSKTPLALARSNGSRRATIAAPTLPARRSLHEGLAVGDDVRDDGGMPTAIMATASTVRMIMCFPLSVWLVPDDIRQGCGRGLRTSGPNTSPTLLFL